MTLSKLEIIEQKFNGIVVFFYCLLILSLPVSIALVESMAGFVVLFFLVKKISLNIELSRSGQKTRWVEILIPQMPEGAQYFQRALSIYIGCVLISVLVSRFPSESWLAFFGKLLEGYYLYVVFVDCIKTRTHFRNCVAFSVAAVFLMSVDGIFQFFSGKDLLRQLPIEGNRVSATLRHANDFGAYLIAIIPMVFGLLILSVRQNASLAREWRKGVIGADWSSKVLLGITFLLMMICLGLTFSRGSWVAFWISLVVFVLLIRKFFFSALAVSLVFLAVFLPFLVKYRDVSFTTDHVSIIREYGNIERTEENLNKLSETERERVVLAHSFQLGMGRFGFWEEATNLIKKHPFFGAGLNSYSKLTTGYAHNCYLQMAAEIGLVGLAAFLAMMGVLFWQSWQVFPKIQNAYFGSVLAGSLAGLAGFLIQSFFDTTLYSVQLGNLMWVLIGFIIVAPRLAHSAE